MSYPVTDYDQCTSNCTRNQNFLMNMTRLLRNSFRPVSPKKFQRRKLKIENTKTYIIYHTMQVHDKTERQLSYMSHMMVRPKGQEYALNDCSETGPHYIPQLLDVLLQFHWNPFAIWADIEKAFLMVGGIHPQERDMRRFLWMKNHQGEFIHQRFYRLMFGLRPSPFILQYVQSLIIIWIEIRNVMLILLN